MTMRLPPLLRAYSLAAIDDALADIHGTSALDFTPSHALTRIVDGVVLDVNRSDPWDLVSEGATATDARMVYGKPDFHSRSLETTDADTYLWRATSQAAFRFAAQSWSLMFPWRIDALGGGSLIMSHIKGPNPDDVYYPTPTVYGENRGWGMSANGDGSCGFLMYGSAGQHNNDFSAYSQDFTDGRWRMVEIGYHATRKESWLTVAQRRDKTNSPMAVNVLHATAPGVGDMTNTDAWFLLGGDYYGIRQANQTGGIGLPLIVFEDTAAENRYAVRIAELPVLQAQLEAYEP